MLQLNGSVVRRSWRAAAWGFGGPAEVASVVQVRRRILDRLVHCRIYCELKLGKMFVPGAMPPLHVLRDHCLYHPVRAFYRVALRGIGGRELMSNPHFAKRAGQFHGFYLHSVVREHFVKAPVA